MSSATITKIYPLPITSKNVVGAYFNVMRGWASPRCRLGVTKTRHYEVGFEQALSLFLCSATDDFKICFLAVSESEINSLREIVKRFPTRAKCNFHVMNPREILLYETVRGQTSLEKTIHNGYTHFVFPNIPDNKDTRNMFYKFIGPCVNPQMPFFYTFMNGMDEEDTLLLLESAFGKCFL